MGITAKDKDGGNYTPVPQGMYHAVCFAVYDLGTHLNTKFNKRERKVRIMFELPDERITITKENGDKLDLPKAISSKFTNSLQQKSNLRPFLESWRGRVFTTDELKGFDLQKLLGVNGYIQVLHNVVDGKTYANIKSITPLPKGFEKRSPENPLKTFSFESDSCELSDDIPQWIKDDIMSSEEWNNYKNTGEAHSNEAPSDDDYPPPDNDDIPF